MNNFGKVLAAGAVAVLPFLPQAASALPSGAFSEIIIDDGWTFEITTCGATALAGGSASCADVTVTALVGSEIGLDVQLANFSVSGFGFADVAFQYIVTAPVGVLIAKAVATQESQVDGTLGDIFATVAEDIDNGIGADDHLDTNDIVNMGMASQMLMDMATLDGLTNSVIVTKDINLSSVGGSGTITRVTQSFAPTAVPEPTAAALLAGLALAFGVVRRRG